MLSKRSRTMLLFFVICSGLVGIIYVRGRQQYDIYGAPVERTWPIFEWKILLTFLLAGIAGLVGIWKIPENRANTIPWLAILAGAIFYLIFGPVSYFPLLFALAALLIVIVASIWPQKPRENTDVR